MPDPCPPAGGQRISPHPGRSEDTARRIALLVFRYVIQTPRRKRVMSHEMLFCESETVYSMPIYSASDICE